ncbi:hypothetical protein BH11PLA2_BH11PLA2_14980 [soil metagenome]
MTTAPQPLIGPTPDLPGALGRGLNTPVPAARLYAWRVGIGFLVLLDVLFLYLADYSALYGEHGYTTSDVSDIHFQPHRAIWSLLRILPQGPVWLSVFVVWAFAALGLTAGIRPRLCAVIAWACSVSVLYANPHMHPGGDRLRCILLFLLIFSPLPNRNDVRFGRLCSGWPVKFILFQLAIMYFFAGAYKLRHPGWQDGTAMYFIMNNSTWSLAPRLFALDVPGSLMFWKLVSWGSVLWEMTFPLLILIPWTRWRLGLGIGIAFHILCAIFLQVSTFPWYSLACYLPLVPWEKCSLFRNRIEQ